MDDRLIADLRKQIRSRAGDRTDLAERAATVLRQQIATGRFEPGERLPSEVMLAQALEISRPTLREAISMLARDGLLRIRHGAGTFVAGEPRMFGARLDTRRSLSDVIRSAGGTPGDSHVGVELQVAPANVAAALGLPPSARVGCVSRVRLIDDRPLAYANEYVRLADADFARLKSFAGGSLYEFLRRTFGTVLVHSTLVIRAVPADAGQAELLALPIGTPLLLLYETNFDVEGKPVLVTVNYHNSEIIEFTLARAGLST